MIYLTNQELFYRIVAIVYLSYCYGLVWM